MCSKLDITRGLIISYPKCKSHMIRAEILILQQITRALLRSILFRRSSRSCANYCKRWCSFRILCSSDCILALVWTCIFELSLNTRLSTLLLTAFISLCIRNMIDLTHRSQISVFTHNLLSLAMRSPIGCNYLLFIGPDDILISLKVFRRFLNCSYHKLNQFGLILCYYYFKRDMKNRCYITF